MSTELQLRNRRRLLAAAGVLLLVALACTCNLPFGAGSQPTATPPPLGVVTLSELKNSVEASASTGAQFVPGAEGQTVGAGGGVRTGPDSRVRADTTDGSLIRLDAGTTLSFASLPGGAGGVDTRLNLDLGQIWAVVSEAPGAGNFEIATPDSLVSAARGSLVNVWYYPDTGRVVVTCLDGTCRLTGSNGQFTDLVGGQQSEIPGAGQNPSTGTPMDGLQLGAWASEVPEAQAVIGKITPAAPAPTAPPQINLTNGSGVGTVFSPSLTFDGQGVLHFIWRSDKLRSTTDIFHQQLPPGGQWSAPETLTTDIGNIDNGPLVQLGSGGAVCVLFTGAANLADGSTWGLFQTCQSNGAWPAPERVNDQTGEFGAAYAPDGSLHTLNYGRLQGVSFNGVTLSVDEGAVLPQFAIDSSGTYHALWVSLGNPFNVVHKASTDGGQTWSAEDTVSTADTPVNGLDLATLADGAGNVHIAWSGNSVCYRRLQPDGTWGEAVAVPGNGGGLKVAVGPDGTVWLAFTGGGEARYSKQGPDGQFQPAVSMGGLGAGSPAIAVDSQRVGHVVWSEGGDFWYMTIAP